LSVRLLAVLAVFASTVMKVLVLVLDKYVFL
jgi:hypothetical protein